MAFTQREQPLPTSLTVRPPWGLRWRASMWFVTLVVSFGIMTDVLVYSVIIPVLPFQLRSLGYSGVPKLGGWVAFAYSVTFGLSTLPLAHISENYTNRRTPMIVSLVVFIGSQIMFMEAPTYWIMVLARALEGMAGSVTFTVGMALVCDSTPQNKVGQQLGLAMSGISLGALLGPPFGGGLYSRFGLRGPVICGIICTTVDLCGRLLLIECKDARRWGFDPAADCPPGDPEKGAGVGPSGAYGNPGNQDSSLPIASDATEIKIPSEDVLEPPTPAPQHLSLFGVIKKLVGSSRALVAVFCSITNAFVLNSTKPPLPLYVNHLWGLESWAVGLIYLGAALPTIFASPLSGRVADKLGPGWVSAFALVLTLPWGLVLIIQSSLALFIAAIILQTFFLACLMAPVYADLHAVSRSTDGVGYAHVYGASSLAWAAGATVGPVVGGQVYVQVKDGWSVLCYIQTGILLVCLALTARYIGSDPLWNNISNARIAIFSSSSVLANERT